MQQLPTPLLGSISAFTITTPDIDRSQAFYQQLGFSEVFHSEWPTPWVQVTDGVVRIMLRKDPNPYIALTYYVKNMDEVVEMLVSKGITFVHVPKKEDMVQRYMFRSPDNLNISLVSMVNGFKKPHGPGLLTMAPEDYFKPEKYVNKACGLFSELAHPVTDLEQSVAFWEKLGFAALSRFTSPYPWAILSDGLSIVGLHQSTHFHRPAITYFASDMPAKLAKLKAGGITGYAGNGETEMIITTPEQQHFFLYQLGMNAHKRQKPEIKLPEINTERLILKEMTPETLRQVLATYPDNEIMALMGLPDAKALATEKDNFQKGMTTYRTSFRYFLLVEKATGKTIGRCGYHNWYALHSRAELGYAMTDEDAKGKGYMKEAIRMIVPYGFEQMGLHRMEAFVGPHNTPSLRLVRGMGFVQEGVLREHFWKNEAWDDSICFALLRSEYDNSVQNTQPG